MKNPTKKHPLAPKLTVLLAAFIAVVYTTQAQVTLTQVTNGLVSFYPLELCGDQRHDFHNA
jgi:hypothetical protein